MDVQTAGGIVIGRGGMIALVRSRNSQSWLFPKGHIEAGESTEEAARREIAEETGLADLELIDDLGSYVRPAKTAEGKSFEQKEIHMFLFGTHSSELNPTREIEEARWFPYRDVPELLGTPHVDWFSKDRAWFTSVFPRVREAIQRD